MDLSSPFILPLLPASAAWKGWGSAAGDVDAFHSPLGWWAPQSVPLLPAGGLDPGGSWALDPGLGPQLLQAPPSLGKDFCVPPDALADPPPRAPDPITGLTPPWPSPLVSGWSPPASDLFVVDDAAPGLEGLALALERAGQRVLRVGPLADPLGAVLDCLRAGGPTDQLHLLGHGRPGRLLLGRAILSTRSLPYQQERWGQIGALLAPTGAIRLYGCDVAANGAGVRLLERLQALTGHAVQASNDPTIQTSSSHDWDLEVSIGAALPVATSQRLESLWRSLDWQGVLAAPADNPFTAQVNAVTGALQIQQRVGAEPQLGDRWQLLTASQIPAGGFRAIEGLALGQGVWLRPVLGTDGLWGEVQRLPGLEALRGLDGVADRASLDRLLAGCSKVEQQQLAVRLHCSCSTLAL